MTEAEYTRVACRGIAAGHLSTIETVLEDFRFNAESAGIRVNERIIWIKTSLKEIGQEIYNASAEDRHALIDPGES